VGILKNVIFALVIATILFSTNVYGITSSESQSKITNAVTPLIKGDTAPVIGKVNQTTGGDWTKIDKFSLSVNENATIDQFAISLFGNDSWIPIVINGTVVNGTVIVPPVDNNQTNPNDNQTNPNDNQTNPNDNNTNPNPKVEVCGDGIDNDGDGLVDEGCPVLPPPNPGDIPDQPSKTVNETQTLRVCGMGDVDNNNGLVTQLSLMNDYECKVFVLPGDYEYTNGQEVIKKINNAGFTSENARIALGNHDTRADTNKFNNVTQAYGTAVLSNNATIEGINFHLSIYMIDGNKFDNTQFNYMKDQIQSDEAQYKFVIVHQPFVVNKGGQHGPNGQFSTWDPLFRGNGVDAVLQAHEHNYQRYDINGLEYIVVGTGTHDTGSSMYKLGDKQFQGFECLKCFTGTNGFVLMDLKIDDPRQHNVNGWFIANNGDIKDKFNLRD